MIGIRLEFCLIPWYRFLEADLLGEGIAKLCDVLHPEVVILGSGVMAQEEYLRAPIRAALDHYLVPTMAKETKLAFATLQNNAGLLGAYYHFRMRQELDR